MRIKLDIYNEIEEVNRQLSMLVWSKNKEDRSIVKVIEKLNNLKEELSNYSEQL